MSDYNGTERRGDPHICHIGEKRFDRVETMVDEVHPIVTNGLSHLPSTLKWGFGLMLTLLMAIVALAGSTRIETSRFGQQLIDHTELQSHGIVDDRLDALERDVEEIGK